MGLMQIMPTTWADLHTRYRLGADPYDIRDNILAGAAYMRELHDRFGTPGFLAAYNGGPGRYERYLATGRPLPDETRAYVAALAPMIDRVPTNVQLAAVARSFAWANSSLFATRNAGIPHDGRSPVGIDARRSSRTPRPCRSVCARSSVWQPFRTSCTRDQIAMTEIALRRVPSQNVACFDAKQLGQGDISRRLRDKSADVCRAHVVGWVEVSRCHARHLTGASGGNTNENRARNAIALLERLVLPS